MSTSIPVLCGSIMGKPFSLSARIHNAAYQALGLDYTFVCFGVENPEAAIEAMRTLGIRGSNVSMPYKQAVIPHLDALDPAAKAIGAVNTINNIEGRLTGYNTDYVGAVRALREVTDPAGKRLAVIGAGGAARAVAYGFREQGARVSVFNRTQKKARELAESLGVHYGGGLEHFDPDAFDVVVNATSVGFRDAGASPLEGRLAAHLIVMDVAFIPTRTRLIAEADALGCTTVPGTRMMIHQSCGQVELYTGVDSAPFEVMEKAMFDEIERLGL
ncbi:shikimate dehydrogenase [Halomonas shantousis]